MDDYKGKDDRTLLVLLQSCTDFQERRKIRTALREVRFGPEFNKANSSPQLTSTSSHSLTNGLSDGNSTDSHDSSLTSSPSSGIRKSYTTRHTSRNSLKIDPSANSKDPESSYRSLRARRTLSSRDHRQDSRERKSTLVEDFREQTKETTPAKQKNNDDRSFRDNTHSNAPEPGRTISSCRAAEIASSLHRGRLRNRSREEKEGTSITRSQSTSRVPESRPTVPLTRRNSIQELKDKVQASLNSNGDQSKAVVSNSVPRRLGREGVGRMVASWERSVSCDRDSSRTSLSSKLLNSSDNKSSYSSQNDSPSNKKPDRDHTSNFRKTNDSSEKNLSRTERTLPNGQVLQEKKSSEMAESRISSKPQSNNKELTSTKDSVSSPSHSEISHTSTIPSSRYTISSVQSLNSQNRKNPRYCESQNQSTHSSGRSIAEHTESRNFSTPSDIHGVNSNQRAGSSVSSGAFHNASDNHGVNSNQRAGSSVSSGAFHNASDKNSSHFVSEKIQDASCNKSKLTSNSESSTYRNSSDRLCHNSQPTSSSVSSKPSRQPHVLKQNGSVTTQLSSSANGDRISPGQNRRTTSLKEPTVVDKPTKNSVKKVVETDVSNSDASETEEELRKTEMRLLEKLNGCTDFSARREIRAVLRKVREKIAILAYDREKAKQNGGNFDRLSSLNGVSKELSSSSFKDSAKVNNDASIRKTVRKEDHDETNSTEFDYSKVEDVDKLKQLLNDTIDFNERRKIRLAIRQLRRQVYETEKEKALGIAGESSVDDVNPLNTSSDIPVLEKVSHKTYPNNTDDKTESVAENFSHHHSQKKESDKCNLKERVKPTVTKANEDLIESTVKCSSVTNLLESAPHQSSLPTIKLDNNVLNNDSYIDTSLKDCSSGRSSPNPSNSNISSASLDEYEAAFSDLLTDLEDSRLIEKDDQEDLELIEESESPILDSEVLELLSDDSMASVVKEDKQTLNSSMTGDGAKVTTSLHLDIVMDPTRSTDSGFPSDSLSDRTSVDGSSCVFDLDVSSSSQVHTPSTSDSFHQSTPNSSQNIPNSAISTGRQSRTSESDTKSRNDSFTDAPYESTVAPLSRMDSGVLTDMMGGGDGKMSVTKEDDGSVTMKKVSELDSGRRIVTIKTRKQKNEDDDTEVLKETVVENKIQSPGGSTMYEKDVVKTKRKITSRGSNYYQRNTTITRRLKDKEGDEVVTHDLCVESENKSVSKGESWGDKTVTKVTLNKDSDQIPTIDEDQESDAFINDDKVPKMQTSFQLPRMNVSKCSSGYGSISGSEEEKEEINDKKPVKPQGKFYKHALHDLKNKITSKTIVTAHKSGNTAKSTFIPLTEAVNKLKDFIETSNHRRMKTTRGKEFSPVTALKDSSASCNIPNQPVSAKSLANETQNIVTTKKAEHFELSMSPELNTEDFERQSLETSISVEEISRGHENCSENTKPDSAMVVLETFSQQTTRKSESNCDFVVSNSTNDTNRTLSFDSDMEEESFRLVHPTLQMIMNKSKKNRTEKIKFAYNSNNLSLADIVSLASEMRGTASPFNDTDYETGLESECQSDDEGSVVKEDDIILNESHYEEDGDDTLFDDEDFSDEDRAGDDVHEDHGYHSHDQCSICSYPLNMRILPSVGWRICSPEIIIPLRDMVAAHGSTVVFESKVVASPLPTITWYLNNEKVEENDYFQPRFDEMKGCAILEMKDISLGDAGIIRCNFRNPLGDAETSCKLSVKNKSVGPPAFTSTLHDITVSEGHSVTMECVVTDAAQILWYRDGIIQRNSSDFRQTFNSNRAKLEIAEVFLDDSGEYMCVAKNEIGEVKTLCHLSVNESVFEATVVPMFLTKLRDQTIKEGTCISLEVEVIGSPQPDVWWQIDGEKLEKSDGCVYSYDGRVARLTLTQPETCDSGRYECIARNAAGKVSLDAQIKVEGVSHHGKYQMSKHQKGHDEKIKDETRNKVNNGLSLHTENKKLPSGDRDIPSAFEHKVGDNERQNSKEEKHSQKTVSPVIKSNGIPSPKSNIGNGQLGGFASIFKTIDQAIEKDKLQQKDKHQLAEGLKANGGIRVENGSNVHTSDDKNESLCSDPKNTDHEKAKFDLLKNNTLVIVDIPTADIDSKDNTNRKDDKISQSSHKEVVNSKTAIPAVNSHKYSTSLTRTMSSGAYDRRKFEDKSSSVKKTETEESAPNASSKSFIQSGLLSPSSDEKFKSIVLDLEAKEQQPKKKTAVTLGRSASFVARQRALFDTQATKSKINMSSIDQIEDEDELHKMMNATENFEERKKIRARMKEIREKKQHEWEERKKELDKNKTDLVQDRLRQADLDKQRKMEQFKDLATKKTETSADGTTTTTSSTSVTEKSEDGKTTTTTVIKKTETTTSKTSGFGGTQYGKPADTACESLTQKLMNASGPGTSGKITVKTESWSSKDGQINKSQKTETWGAKKPQSAMAAFKKMDNAANPQPAKANVGGGAGRGANITRNPSAIKQMLLDWTKAMTQEYTNISVTNFSTSWASGLAFCALIHHFYPDAFDYSKLEAKNRRANFQLAFDTAEKLADAAPLLDVEDMVMMKKPDWKCVFTYVQSLYRHLRDHENNKVAPPPES